MSHSPRFLMSPALVALLFTTPALGQGVTDTVASLTASEKMTCLTTTGWAGYCWGEDVGARGTGQRINPWSLRALAPGSRGLCGLTFEGEIWCNSHSPDSVRAERVSGCASPGCLEPLKARGRLPPGAVRAVVHGSHHACAIGADARAYCWGANWMGQLGTGSWEKDHPGHQMILRAPAPVVGDLRFARLSAREFQTCGLTIEVGEVYCWGYGQSGQTGDSAVVAACKRLQDSRTPCSTLIPVRVLPESLAGDLAKPSVQFTSVAAAGRLACAVSADGGAYCWGDNYRCALGRCRSGDSWLARRIAVPGRVVEVGAGYRFACARTADGRIYCWGDNTDGQLGSLVSVNTGPDGLPPDYRDSTAAEVRSAAYADPCFLGGRCSPAAAEVASPHRWSALAVGQRHACALATDDGGVYCWGGGDPRVLGQDKFPITCVNRSFTWPNRRCQATPVRVPGLPSLAARPAGSQPPPVPSPRDPLSSTRVEVSTRKLRITFPVDTTGWWGWPARQTDLYQSYSWSAFIGGMDGPVFIDLSVYHRDSTARAFASLDNLIANNRPRFCRSGMIQTCRDGRLVARVESGRIVMTLEDSVAITRLFGTHPDSIRVTRRSPNDPPDESALVPVQYVAPLIPWPDSALLAEAERGRRRYKASITTISRHISGGEGWWGMGHIWVAVGDSVPVQVEETECHHDYCGIRRQVGDSGWKVDDTTVAQLRPTCGRGCAMVHGRRLGKTVVRVQGLHGASDTMPSRKPPPRSLERKVVVGRPVARIALVPRPDTAVVGRSYSFGARAYDRAGRVVPDVPIEITVDIGHNLALLATMPSSAEFRKTGRRLVVASFRGLVDTLVVTVRDSLKH